MAATVSWISTTPIKGLRVQEQAQAQLTAEGIPGDRAMFLVDQTLTMVNGKRLGTLVTVEAQLDADAGVVALRFPDGQSISAPIELGLPEDVRFYGLRLSARPVRGPFSAALSEHCGQQLRLFAAPRGRSAVDRGREGAVTLLSTASLERLQVIAGEARGIDRRRFRMSIGIDGLNANEEDDWIEQHVRVGAATLSVRGNVGRCVVTTRNADTGVVDLRTLHHLAAYRSAVPTTEPLPFGVHARVLEPGLVRVGDAVAPA